MKGQVKWYQKEKGYGFIVGEDDKDYFVHYTAMPQDQEEIREEDNVNVTFDPKETDRGVQAQNVVFVEKKEE
ncbi:MAG: cold-shock protein [Nanoarchaeota archaeon]